MAPDTISQPHLRPGVDSVKMSCYKMSCWISGTEKLYIAYTIWLKENYRIDR